MVVALIDPNDKQSVMKQLANLFDFESFTLDLASGEIELRYGYPEYDLRFRELVYFTPPSRSLSDAERQAAYNAAKLIFLLSGVSYAKTFMPQKMRYLESSLPDDLSNFIATVYAQGLAECAFRNDIDIRNRLSWESCNTTNAMPDNQQISRHSNMHRHDSPISALVPIGGGKDSLVTWEALREAGIAATGFVLAAAGAELPVPLANTITNIDAPVSIVRRKLDNQLSALNNSGHAINGHVPITAIVSSIAALVAVINGHNYVVFSNERSANEPTRESEYGAVNHQYSKSQAFEAAFAATVKNYVSQSVSVFSLLRPYTEVAIASRFAELRQWHRIFCSCNATFRHTAANRYSTWCGDCPKCRFVYMALAPFLSPQSMIDIFSRDLLADAAQIYGFLRLLDLADDKPFECVGTAQESRLIVWNLAQNPNWQWHVVVRALAERLGVRPNDYAVQWQDLMKPSLDDNMLPDDFRHIIYQYGS